MTTTLYDASVGSFIQGLSGLQNVLQKGAAHCADHDIDLDEVVASRLHPDMLPFRFQVNQAVRHSVGAWTGVQAGVFTPGPGPEVDYAGLQDEVNNALEILRAISPDQVNGIAGGDMLFKLGSTNLQFDAAMFLLTFSVPNFYFHTSMSYAILRSLGAPLGKRNYMGQLRMKG